ncbi:MAG: hypothetical protein WDO06_08755 [Actinomycetota bacterium]
MTILYSSILAIDAQHQPTAGEIRLAVVQAQLLTGVYQSLDSPNNAIAISGYDIALNKTANGVIATWLTAPPTFLATTNADSLGQCRFTNKHKHYFGNDIWVAKWTAKRW